MDAVSKHTDIFTRRDLQRLLDVNEGPCVSLYMPSERRGSEIEQNPIRYKNLVNEIESQLVAEGLRQADVDDFIAPLRGFMQPEDTALIDFWRYQSEGLAVFYSPELFHYYRLPVDFDSLAVVGDRFHVTPLIPLLTDNSRFYVLALDLGEVSMYQGNRQQIAALDLDSAPESLAETLRFDQFERQLQFHTSEMNRNGQHSAMYHGHGAAGDEETKAQILRFFQQLDNGVIDYLNENHAPLILAGLPHLQGIYREANHYPHLTTEGIDTHPRDLNEEELHAAAWDIVEAQFEQQRQEARASYQHLAGTDNERAADDIETIVSSAHFQRIDTLFIQRGEQLLGEFDPQTNRLSIQNKGANEGEDLLNLAALHTLVNGGSIYVLEPADMPTQAVAAAILRY